jgi:probable HAF family extracellular repeat protein
MHILRHLFIAVCAALCAQISVATETHTIYRVTILSDAGATGRSIDAFGIVAGRYTLPNNSRHAAIWAFGRQIDLGALGSTAGLNSTVLWPVKNYLGIVSGISYTDALDPNKEVWSCGAFLANPNFNVCRGFVWTPWTGKMRALGALPGGTNSFATGSNDLGQTVGWAENGIHDPKCIHPQVLQFKPVVWGPGRDEIRPLPLIEDDQSGAATALNDRGQIVGISGDCGVAVGSVTAKHAVIWDNGVATEIKNPNGAEYWNTPMMINERGDVVGFAGVPDDPEGNLTPPFMWTRKEGWTVLPLLKGDVAGVANSINNRRQVVGYSNDPSSNFHAWIWENGRTTDLNCLIEPGSDLTGPVTGAYDINDRGEITGRSSTGQALLATPIRVRGHQSACGQ